MDDGNARDVDLAAEREFRLTLRLSPEVRDALEWLAKDRDVSLIEAIRHAISTEKFIMEVTRKQARILIEQPGERLREIIMR